MDRFWYEPGDAVESGEMEDGVCLDCGKEPQAVSGTVSTPGFFVHDRKTEDAPLAFCKKRDDAERIVKALNSYTPAVRVEWAQPA